MKKGKVALTPQRRLITNWPASCYPMMARSTKEFEKPSRTCFQGETKGFMPRSVAPATSVVATVAKNRTMFTQGTEGAGVGGV
ncbi:MAG: hypothetical protein V3R38_02010 [bacterium]